MCSLKYTEKHFFVVLYGYETWYVIARKPYRLRLLENKALRSTFECEGKRVDGGCKKYIKRSFMIIFQQIILRILCQAKLDGWPFWHIWRRRDLHTAFGC